MHASSRFSILLLLALVPGGHTSVRPSETLSGTAPRVVFIHGLAASSRQWEPVRRALPTSVLSSTLQWDAALVDSAGMSRSNQELRVELDSILKSTRTPILLVGHSVGAVFAIQLAAEYRDRTRGLVLIEPPADVRSVKPSDFEALQAALLGKNGRAVASAIWTRQLDGADSSIRRQVLAELEATTPSSIARTYAGLRRFDPLPALADVRSPALIIGREEQRMTAAFLLAGGKTSFVAVDAKSHWIHLERPREIANIIDSLLIAGSR